MSHTNFLFHIVFGTKGRFPFLLKEWRGELFAYMGGIVRNSGGIAFEINGIEDHVHLLVKLSPTIKFSDVLRDLKSSSSKWAKSKSQKFAWQRRYGAFTVSESQFEIVRNYIRKQEDHHRKFDFKSEFESLLRANNIEVDECLWRD